MADADLLFRCLACGDLMLVVRDGSDAECGTCAGASFEPAFDAVAAWHGQAVAPGSTKTMKLPGGGDATGYIGVASGRHCVIRGMDMWVWTGDLEELLDGDPGEFAP